MAVAHALESGGMNAGCANSVKIARGLRDIATRHIQPFDRANDQVNHRGFTVLGQHQARAVRAHLAFDLAVREQNRRVPRRQPKLLEHTVPKDEIREPSFILELSLIHI